MITGTNDRMMLSVDDFFLPFNQEWKPLKMRDREILMKSKAQQLHASSQNIFSWSQKRSIENQYGTDSMRGKMIFHFLEQKKFKTKKKKTNGALNISDQMRICRRVHYGSMKNLEWITRWFKTLFDFVIFSIVFFWII